MRKEIWKRVKPWCVPVSVTLLFYLILQFVVLIGYVPSASMEPTLPKGSFIFGLRIFDEPQVGDIIVFKKDGALQVKRVAAGPGDTVDLRQIRYMNDYPVPTWESPVITVPDGCYFVLGDNTENSLDSRYWPDPFVPEQSIIAKLFMKHKEDTIYE